MKDKFYSMHIFLFPFRWRYRDGNGFSDMDDRKTLANLKGKINTDFWETFEFSHKVYDEYQTYNEYVYFYPHVRDILSIKDPEEERMLNVLQYQYRLNRKENAQYIIRLNDSTEYSLHIDDITLNFYPHGVGMFVFHLRNFKHRQINDILKINEYGRRIFPQFLGHEASFVSAPKGSFLAEKISLENVDTEYGYLVEEDFSYYNHLDNLNRRAFRLPAFIGKLLGKSFYSEYGEKPEILLTPVLDDRMFVVSYYLNSQWMVELKKWNNREKSYAYKSSELWYQYIFVDGKDPSVQNREWLCKQLEEHSYARWLEWGQLFGISRYSFVVVVSDGDFTRKVISKHISNVYFQLVQLTLMQRAHLVVFGSEVARLANALRARKNMKETKKIINDLYLDYIKFINRIYFREVTAQEQGIELYDMLQEKMRIKRDVDDLDREIGELNEYLERYEESRLTRLAALYLPVTLLAGILGMNTLGVSGIRWAGWKNAQLWPTVLGAITFLVFLYAGYLFYKQITKKL